MTPIKRRNGNVIGFLRDVNARRKQILARSGKVLDWYDATTDKTFDGGGHFLGVGDLRAALLANVL